MMAPHTDLLERIRPYSSTLFGFLLTFFASISVDLLFKRILSKFILSFLTSLGLAEAKVKPKQLPTKNYHHSA